MSQRQSLRHQRDMDHRPPYEARGRGQGRGHSPLHQLSSAAAMTRPLSLSKHPCSNGAADISDVITLSTVEDRKGKARDIQAVELGEEEGDEATDDENDPQTCE